MMWIKYLKFLGPVVLVIGVLLYGEYRYHTAVSNTEDRLNNEYNEKLVEVMDRNNKLVLKQKAIEEEHTNELFELHENADAYIANVRTDVKRLYITTKERCLPEDESNTNNVIGRRRFEIPKDIAERLVRRREEADRLVIKLNACTTYIKNNYEHVNNFTE